jgi:DNA-binding CsgD family transcriptional regulator
MVLSARHPNDQMMLRKLVAAVADGSAGGALRLRNADTEPAQHAPLADLVSPAMRLSVSPACDECQVLPGTAMVVARHLRQTPLPPASLMSELYGLTRAEAEVALRFSGGATAEEVARMRQVSLETVRSQVKTILRKTNAANLRDLERVITISSAMVPEVA